MPKKTVSDAEAQRLASNYWEARDRARTRQEVPGGGDPFFTHMKAAERHWESLKSGVGKRRAEALVGQEEERRQVRYVFEGTSEPGKTRRRSR